MVVEDKLPDNLVNVRVERATGEILKYSLDKEECVEVVKRLVVAQLNSLSSEVRLAMQDTEPDDSSRLCEHVNTDEGPVVSFQQIHVASLRLEPIDQLSFSVQGQAAEASSSTLILTNTSAKGIEFKVMGNAPAFYTIHGGRGIIEPKGQSQVKITLKPEGHVDASDRKQTVTKHRFLVQATLASSETLRSTEQWSELDAPKIWKRHLEVAQVSMGQSAEKTST